VNAFHVIGGLFALWAVALTAVGITHENFPRAGGQALVVGAVSIVLAAGRYDFFCSVPGHRQAGMEGTLTVK
jgi:azurin